MEVVEGKLSVEEIMDMIVREFRKTGLSYNFTQNKPLRFLEQSLLKILNNIYKDSDREDIIDVECDHANDGRTHYISAKVTITIGNSMVYFYIDEVLGNCSTVSIHHFSGSYMVKKEKDVWNTPAIFERQEQFDEFMLCLELFLTGITRYTNIFYSISSESDLAFAKFCESSGAKLIDEFRSARNGHIIKYYSKRL